MNYAFACPHCQEPINLDESYKHQIETGLAKKYNQHVGYQKAELKRQVDDLHQQLAVQVSVNKQQDAISKAVDIKLRAIQKTRDESQFHADQQQELINSTTLQLTAMKRTIEQGPQQTQG